MDIPFRAGRDHWNGESFDPGVWLGAVEVPFVVAAAKREREVAQVPRRGTCKCVRAGSAVRELFRGRCATVRAGARVVPSALRAGGRLLLVLGRW